MEEKILIKGKFLKTNILVSSLGGIAIIFGIIGLALFINGYVPYTNNTAFEGLILLCIAGAFLVIATLFYLIMNNCEIIISSKKVSGKIKFGKRVDLPINQISSVGQGWFKSITVATSSGIIRFWLLENRQEVFSAISDLLSQIQNNPQTISVNSISGNADELKKFKELLDSGIITQDEFNNKKGQLLGLSQTNTDNHEFMPDNFNTKIENPEDETEQKLKSSEFAELNKKKPFILILLIASIVSALFLFSKVNKTHIPSEDFKVCDYSGNAILENDDIQSAKKKISNGQHCIELKLSREGQEKFAEATKVISKSKKNYTYVMQDEIVISIPYVTQEINTDTLLITIAE